MAQPYSAKNGTAHVVPTSGSFTTEEMSGDYGVCRVYIEFFSDSAGKVPATPTAGLVKLEVSALGNVFVPMDNAIDIPAAAIAAGAVDASSYFGMATHGRVTFTGIVGAAYARVVFWRASDAAGSYAMRANVQSVLRTLSSTVQLITPGRPNIRALTIQNRDGSPVYFWHGKMYAGANGDGAELPLDPAEWTPTQMTDAKNLIVDKGERINSNDYVQAFVAHSGRLYGVVNTGTATVHVKVGV